MSRLFTITLFLLTQCGLLCAQSNSNPQRLPSRPVKATFYYNVTWELTTHEKSFYRREAWFDFSDMVFDGVYRDYNKDGVLIAEGFYTHGVQTGLQTEYYNNRSVRSTIEYDGNDFTIWEFHDENKMDSIIRGNGTFSLSYFYLSGLVSQPSWKQGVLKGTFQSGKKAGIWVYEDIGKKKTDEEYYEKGNLKRRIHYSETGTVELDYKKEIIISLNSLVTETLAYDRTEFNLLNEFFEQEPMYPASLQRDVAYPGGIRRLLLLLAQNSVVPEGNLCKVRLRVDERGKVTKYTIVEPVDPETDNQVAKAISNHEKKFLPALKNGLPYPSYIFLPVSSGSTWIEFLKTASLEEIMSAQ